MKPRPRAGGIWTEARYWGFIRSALRAASMKYPVRQQVLVAARTGREVNPHTGRKQYKCLCAMCRLEYWQRDCEVDHVVPCGTLKTAEDLAGFVERMFCEPANLQVLCRKCHLKKGQQDMNSDAQLPP